MKHLKYIIIPVVLILVMAACAAPAAAPTITNVAWKWTNLVETSPASQSVIPNSQNYTITFTTDGKASIKADCNAVQGTYTMNGSNLTIQLGPSTMAFCGDQSSDQLFLQNLVKVANYKLEGDKLTLGLSDGGSMGYTK